jgi:hypothetical protein
MPTRVTTKMVEEGTMKMLGGTSDFLSLRSCFDGELETIAAWRTGGLIPQERARLLTGVLAIIAEMLQIMQKLYLLELVDRQTSRRTPSCHSISYGWLAYTPTPSL